LAQPFEIGRKKAPESLFAELDYRGKGTNTLSTISDSVSKVKPPYIQKLLHDGLTYRGERFKALPHVVRYGFFHKKLTDAKDLASFVLAWIKEKHNGFSGKFISNWEHAALTVKNLVNSHLQWAADKKKLDPIIQDLLNPMIQPMIDMTIEVFAPKNKVRAASVQKLETIIRKVLQYVYERGSSGVVALPKVVFLTAGAFDGSRNGLCHYLNIKKALGELGVLEYTGNPTFQGGPCKTYKVDFGDYMKFAPEDEFIDRKHRGKRVITDLDNFTSEIMGTDVSVSGSEVQEFAKVFEKKLREYKNNYYINILPIKRAGSIWAYYVRGAAICKLHSFDSVRFIEAQFYFFHQWQDEAPNIKYITSIASQWNSIGRYHAYCGKFNREIGTLDGGIDNIEAVTERNKTLPSPLTSGAADYLRGKAIFETLQERYDLSANDIFMYHGYPLSPKLPIEFLKTQAKWLTLLLEEAWGETVNNAFFKTNAGMGVFS
jgi:hypothetical protein